MKLRGTALLAATLILSAARGRAGELTPNTWVKVSENAVGPRFSPAVIWSKKLKRFVLIGGEISHHFRSERPWDVQTFDLGDRKWRNHLPKGAEKLGGETGNVKDPGFKSPYFVMGDKAGIHRPNRRDMLIGFLGRPWSDLRSQAGPHLGEDHLVAGRRVHARAARRRQEPQTD